MLRALHENGTALARSVTTLGTDATAHPPTAAHCTSARHLLDTGRPVANGASPAPQASSSTYRLGP